MAIKKIGTFEFDDETNIENILVDYDKFKTRTIKKQFEEEQKTILEQERENIRNQILQEQNQANSRNEFLNSVPTQNRQVISDLLDAGKTTQDITNNYNHLLQNQTPVIDIEALVEGKVKEINMANLETDEQFLSKVEKDGLSKDSPAEHWERFARLKNIK